MSAPFTLARLSLLGLLFGVLFLDLRPAALQAQQPEKTPDKPRAESVARMKAVADSIRLLADAGRDESAVKLSAEPILAYTDNTRDNRDSSLWVWTSGGRPAAVLAVELYPEPPKGPRWLFEIASLSEKRIAARHATDLNWTAKTAGLEWAPLAEAPPPAESPLRRLAQMKAIFRQFAAHESEAIEGRIQLRHLTSPLVRYADEDAGLLDGAIFAFASGTNPEVLAVIEAHSAKDAPPRWRCAFAPMTGAAVHVERDNKEVWRQGTAFPPATRDGYVNGWLSARPAAK